ncbi:uncharacterized protein DNG_10202 [Cephalotrichum gorgonifer]|uniref:MFS transporter n=1 Tax=Cephalotrichum gorgonifer TaxID=2041049 RepID=A0AAE8N8S7_9PEZI|nr:uncharacterized protein DNG_10202 [Cephalotrichum gorgonifer]
MARIQLFALLLGAFLALAAASSPQSFCKCTCFKNSTIIPLSTNRPSQLLLRSLDPLDASTPEAPRPAERRWEDGHLAKRASQDCLGCTKKFCRDQNLPFCHDATDDDVSTYCFQRDSKKDRLIVWAFILGTLGLLGWVAFTKLREARGLTGSVFGRFSRSAAAGEEDGGGAYRPLGGER